MIMKRLLDRLVVPAEMNNTKLDFRRYAARKGRQFCVKSDALDGIIAHLTRDCGGNVHSRDVVMITSSWPSSNSASVWDKRYVADLRANSGFESDARPRSEKIVETQNNWICYDFKDRRVIVTNYSVRSAWNTAPNFSHPKCWAVDVSMDMEKWTAIDVRENNSDLNGPDITTTYTASKGVACRFVRLSNIGRNHYGNDRLLISSFEIFGVLLEWH
jgi:hypothetical protein